MIFFLALALGAEPKVIFESKHEKWLEWQVTEHPKAQDPEVAAYLANVSKVSTLDQVELLKQQRLIYQHHGYPKEVRMFDLMLTRFVPNIRQANSIEQFLLGEQLRFAQEPTAEFIALGFRSPFGRTVLARFGRLRAAAPRRDESFEQLVTEKLRGNVLEFHLHNHPFFIGNPSGDIAGTVIPSGPDRSSWQGLKANHGLEQGRVTNGASTLELPASEFHLLEP